MKLKYIDIFAEDKSAWEDQMSYKSCFMSKYKDQFENGKAFYFDNIELVDEATSKTIPGVTLGDSTWKEITSAILEHFNIAL